MRRQQMRRAGMMAALVGLVLSGAAGMAQQQPPQNTPRNVPDFLNRLPDANDQARMRQENPNQPNYESLNALRRKEVNEDAAKLVKLANDLKDELDKTDRDTLSVSAIKKAEQIEKLAKNLKNKMTVTVNGQ